MLYYTQELKFFHKMQVDLSLKASYDIIQSSVSDLYWIVIKYLRDSKRFNRF